MIVIVSKYLIPRGFRGFTFFPFVVLSHSEDKNDRVVINHEQIHIRQQLEMLILPFYIWYFLEFLIRIIQYKSTSKAYRNVSFEREAYANEKDLNYINKRSFWKFIKYILKEN